MIPDRETLHFDDAMTYEMALELLGDAWESQEYDRYRSARTAPFV